MKKISSNSIYVFAMIFSLFSLAFTEQAGCQPMNQTGVSRSASADEIIDLDGTWMMKDFTRGMGIPQKAYLPGNQPADVLPCRVPGTVRTALLEAGKIPDPYFGYDNEKSLWTEQKEWWFYKKFDVPAGLHGKYIELEFAGILFMGECWVNGQKAGELKGMLNPRSFDVSPLLKYGHENTIAVRLEAPPDAWSSTMKDNLTWFTSRDQLYSIAQSMYGWDWGPHGVNIGIWQPVKLRVTGAVRINQPYIRTTIPSAKEAVCRIQMELQNLSDKPVQTELSGSLINKQTKREAGNFKQQVQLDPGERRIVSLELTVKKPELWWPNGMGVQNLYLLNARATVNNSESDKSSVQFGIRELKLVNNENTEEFVKQMKQQEGVGNIYSMGKAVGSYPWTFQINGKKLFIKGGSWVPCDQLLRLDHGRYERLLKLFKDGNFNLIRIWGGGLYETDDFYDLCDEYGILNWQEFLSNRNFSNIDRKNFLEGAESAILRIRNHPSLTFWCGGNEFDPDDKGSKVVIDSLGALLNRLDPQREFHRASPYKGDDHYWGVWHGQQPYTAYRVVRPFRSEAGINAPPVWENYQKFTPKNLIWPPDSIFIDYHGENNTNYMHLKKMLRYADEFGESDNMQALITKSQLYQALADAFDMEFCRSNKFRNSGFLVWQYNDIWPCLSWSIVDWYGTPKPSYYFMKRAARPVHISGDYERYLWKTGETFKADVYLLNDTWDAVKRHTFKAKILDYEGNTLAEKSGAASADPNRSEKIAEIDYTIADTFKGKMFFLSVELFDKSGTKISDAIYPIAVSSNDDLNDYKDIFTQMNKMPVVSLRAEALTPAINFDKSGNGTVQLRITNPGKNLAYFIRTRMKEESDALRTEYNDNYISLLPGETRTISVNIESTDVNRLPGEINFEFSGYNCKDQTIPVSVTKE